MIIVFCQYHYHYESKIALRAIIPYNLLNKYSIIQSWQEYITQIYHNFIIS